MWAILIASSLVDVDVKLDKEQLIKATTCLLPHDSL
jgi:hypothetical protein